MYNNPSVLDLYKEARESEREEDTGLRVTLVLILNSLQ